jgi:hypothetical protein
MIVVKNSQLDQEVITAFQTVAEAKLPAKQAFRLMRIIKEITSLIEDKIKLEKKILDKYGEKNDKEGYNSEMNEFLSIENEIEYDKINFDDLNLEFAKVSDLMKLDFLFE